MTHRYWTPTDDRRLFDLVSSGLQDAAIAAELGRSHSSVVQRRRGRGLKLLRPVTLKNFVRPKMPHETVSTICEMVEAGASGPEVARRVGISVGVVEYYARREGAVRPNARAGRDVRPIDADLVSLSASGVTNAEISRRLKLTVSIVRTRLTTLARREMVAEARAGF